VQDLNQPTFRLHPLKGTRKGVWAVTVKASMRRPASVNNNLSRARLFWGSRKGACPLAGGAAVIAAWGEPARPGFPFRETGKGLKIPSLLPQAMNSVYSRFNPSLHNRRFALLPFALFVERLAPVPVGVLNILFGCCHLKASN
jgi:hypothetical protein